MVDTKFQDATTRVPTSTDVIPFTKDPLGTPLDGKATIADIVNAGQSLTLVGEDSGTGVAKAEVTGIPSTAKTLMVEVYMDNQATTFQPAIRLNDSNISNYNAFNIEHITTGPVNTYDSGSKGWKLFRSNVNAFQGTYWLTNSNESFFSDQKSLTGQANKDSNRAVQTHGKAVLTDPISSIQFRDYNGVLTADLALRVWGLT